MFCNTSFTVVSIALAASSPVLNASTNESPNCVAKSLALVCSKSFDISSIISWICRVKSAYFSFHSAIFASSFFFLLSSACHAACNCACCSCMLRIAAFWFAYTSPPKALPICHSSCLYAFSSFFIASSCFLTCLLAFLSLKLNKSNADESKLIEP